MHFWIDKRSQQCGFGRSRVAASLSGAGGSGFAFGHPPRRIPSNKTTINTSNYNSTNVPIHRQQHQQHQQQQQLQTFHGDYRRYGNSYTSSSSHHHHHRHNNNNNNNNNNNDSNSHINNNNSGITSSTQTMLEHNNDNNNCIQLNETEQSCTGIGISASINNNNSSNCTVRHTALSNNATNREHIAEYNEINTTQRSFGSGGCHEVTRPHYDMRNYYHPQFGNMSVRHYQSGTLASSNITDRRLETESSNCPYNTLPLVNGQQQQQQAQQEITPSPFTDGTNVMQQSLRSGNTSCGNSEASHNVSNLRVSNNSNSNIIHHHCHSHSPHTTALHSMNSVDNQLLPTHLKCGMCASLVLASVFVAGAKFYFDHQGTGLEVLIFCAFCATFFLAACTVSLCRVPKILLPQQQQQQQQQHSHQLQQRTILTQHRTNRSVNFNVHDGPQNTSENDTLNINNMIMVSDLNELQENNVTSAVNGSSIGPPPYHIAILLPETKILEKMMTSSSPSVEESPPPSYDKIVV